MNTETPASAPKPQHRWVVVMEKPGGSWGYLRVRTFERAMQHVEATEAAGLTAQVFIAGSLRFNKP